MYFFFFLQTLRRLSATVKTMRPCSARQNLKCSSTLQLKLLYRNLFRSIFHSYHPLSETGQYCSNAAQVGIKGLNRNGIVMLVIYFSPALLLLLAVFSLFCVCVCFLSKSCRNSATFEVVHRCACHDDRFAK